MVEQSQSCGYIGNLIWSANTYTLARIGIPSKTTVLFWYPPDPSEDVGVADLKAWCKSERVFIGRDLENKTQVIEDLMQNDQNVVVVNSLDSLIERMAAWVNR